MAPQVAVLITSLNRPEYLRAACRSVLEQEVEDLEVIICDDASDRAARDTAADLAEQDPRVRVVQNDQRLGQYRTIARATRDLQSPYFAILNDDDLWEPGFLSALIPPLRNDSSLVASFCDHYIMDEMGAIDFISSDTNTRSNHRADLTPGKHTNGSYLAFGLSAFPTVVASAFRTSAVDWERYRGAAMDVGGFYDLWLQCCLLGGTAAVWYEPSRLSRYRVHPGQLSARPSVALGRAKAWIWEDALDAGDMTAVEREILRQLSRTNHALGMTYLRRGQLALGRSYLWRACGHSLSPRSIVGLFLTVDSGLVAPLRRRMVRPNRR